MTAKRLYGKNKTKPVAVKPKRVRKTSRRLFSVSEDMKLLKYWRTHHHNESLATMASALTRTVKRTAESIRDRLRRYISQLQPSEAASLEEMSKRNPESTVMFLIHNYIPSDRMEPTVQQETAVTDTSAKKSGTRSKTAKKDTIDLNGLLNGEMDTELRDILRVKSPNERKKTRGNK